MGNSSVTTAIGGATMKSAVSIDATEDQRRFLRLTMADPKEQIGRYRAMEAAEHDEHLASVYERLAQAEERHLSFWEQHLRSLGVDPGPRRPSWRARLMARLARIFGPRIVLPTVATFEQVDQAGYDNQAETADTGMRDQERSHARVLCYLMAGSPQGVAGETLARLEGRHRSVGGNTLRAAVLGANDGLTSNLALVMGVAGANLSTRSVLITGLSGLLAGVFSMAIGEWISVQSARELYERQVKTEAGELRTVPDEEQEELALIYEAKGLPQQEAEEVAGRLMEDHRAALDALVREKLGLNPDQLGGSPAALGDPRLSSSLSVRLSRSFPTSPVPTAEERSSLRAPAPPSGCSPSAA